MKRSYSGIACLGARRVDEARPPPFLRVAVERELGDHEQRAADIGEREVHLVLGVGEDPQPDDLVRHPPELLLRIVVGEPDEHDETRVDASGDTAGDANLGATDPLQQSSHLEVVGL